MVQKGYLSSNANRGRSLHMIPNCRFAGGNVIEKPIDAIEGHFEPCIPCTEGFESTSGPQHWSIAVLEAMHPDDWPPETAGGVS